MTSSTLHTSAQHGRHTLDGVVWNSLSQAAVLLVGFATVIYLPRALGIGAYGQFAVTVTVAQWMTMIGVGLFTAVTIKFISAAGEHWQSVAAVIVRLHVLYGLAAMAALFLAAPIVAGWLGSAELTPHLRVASLDIPLFVVGHAYLNVLLGAGRFRYRAAILAMRWVARLGVMVLLVEAGWGVTGALWGCVAASAVELALGAALCPLPLMARASGLLKPMWDYARPVILTTVSMRTLVGLDLVALGVLGHSEAEQGLYAAALNLTLVPTMIIFAAFPVVMSTVSRLLAARHDQAAWAVGWQSLRLAMLTTPLLILAATSSEAIAVLMFGMEYAAAGPLLSVLLLGCIGRVLLMASRTLISAAGEPGWSAWFTAPLVPLAIVGYAIAVPRFGLAGAVWVSCAVFTLGGAASTLAVLRHWPVAWRGGTIGRCAIVSLAAAALGLAWPAHGPMVLLKLAAGSAAILAALAIGGEFNREDWRLIHNWLCRRTSIADAEAQP